MMTRGCLLALLLLSAGGVAADQVLPERWLHEDQELQRKASDAVHYARLFHVYDAALYVPAGVATSQVLAGPATSCLVIAYRMGVEAQRLRDAAETVLQRQIDDLEPLAVRIAKLHAAYRDVESGDRYTLCYAPAAGTTLQLNDELLVSVEGADFARAYFGIWLAEEAIAPRLREALLAGQDRLGRA
jgi:hypothetical protein